MKLDHDKKKKNEDKVSFADIATLYGVSRQRLDTAADEGRAVMQALVPLFFRVKTSMPPVKPIGSSVTFTHVAAPKWEGPEGIYRACICCEEPIEPDDEDCVISIVDRNEVAWCSRECAVAFPVDAWVLSSKYKRHWSVVALDPEVMEDRRLVRDMTKERLDNIKTFAVNQGYIKK